MYASYDTFSLPLRMECVNIWSMIWSGRSIKSRCLLQMSPWLKNSTQYHTDAKTFGRNIIQRKGEILDRFDTDHWLQLRQRQSPWQSFHFHRTRSTDWTLTPFVPNEHWAAGVQRVFISLTISAKVPPKYCGVLLDDTMCGFNKSLVILATISPLIITASISESFARRELLNSQQRFLQVYKVSVLFGKLFHWAKTDTFAI